MSDNVKVLVELRGQDEYNIVKQVFDSHRASSVAGQKVVAGSASSNRIVESLRLKPVTNIKRCLLETLLSGKPQIWVTFAETVEKFTDRAIFSPGIRVEAALREISWQMNEVFGRGWIKAISLLVEKRRSDEGQSSYQLTREGRESVIEYLIIID